MRESLLTIPVNEVFEPKEGCPFCAMRDTVELHICEYIMGAAMMEPDVREDTNRLGFCRRHFTELRKQNNKLSLGLMLNSHLQTVREELFAKKGIFPVKDKRTEKAAKSEESCFVCSKTGWGMEHMAKSFFMMFKEGDRFKRLLSEQEYICMPHYAWIRGLSVSMLSKAELPAFLKILDTLTEKYAASLNRDIDDFCNSFDYRNAGKLHSPEMEHVRTAVNRAILFLTGRNADS